MPAGAATGTTGVHTRSGATCKAISSPVVAMNDVVSVAAPVIDAANTSSMLDGQTVSFRQRLLKWNGSSWAATNQYSAVWSGFATHATAALDFSNGSQTVRRPTFNFTAGAGYDAVVTDYWWGATNRTSGGSDMANRVALAQRQRRGTAASPTDPSLFPRCSLPGAPNGVQNEAAAATTSPRQAHDIGLLDAAGMALIADQTAPAPPDAGPSDLIHRRRWMTSACCASACYHRGGQHHRERGAAHPRP